MPEFKIHITTKNGFVSSAYYEETFVSYDDASKFVDSIIGGIPEAFEGSTFTIVEHDNCGN